MVISQASTALTEALRFALPQKLECFVQGSGKTVLRFGASVLPCSTARCPFPGLLTLTSSLFHEPRDL